MKAQHLLLCLPLATIGCASQGLFFNEQGHPKAVVNNNFLNKIDGQRFVFKYDPQTKEIEMRNTYINADQTGVANNALLAYAGTVYAKEETARAVSSDAVDTERVKQSTEQVKALSAPTVYAPAEQAVSRGAEVMAPVIP